LDEWSGYSQGVQEVTGGGERVGDWLHDPWKIIVDEIEVQLLESGENIGSRDDQSRNVECLLLAINVVTVPREQC
jgi:hypothetical protein